jgi:uncharacterized protein
MTTAFEQLLVVQDHDTEADRLRHRRSSLPQRAELAQVEAALTQVGTAAAAVEAEVSVLALRQRRLEDELEATELKVHELDRKLYGGTVSSPRELQAIQADIDGLRRHASHVEDELLELLETREPHDAEAAKLAADQGALRDRSDALRSEIAAAEAEINVELDAVLRARGDASAGVSADLLTLYDQLRQRLGGIGAARLEPGGRCGGCHLTLPATEVARIKREPLDSVVRCDQCSRILVRAS